MSTRKRSCLRRIRGAWTKNTYFNVRNFGATGNGTTDDTVAINAAGAAASANGGGVVYFPNGTYGIDV
jgi:polygalacturonase